MPYTIYKSDGAVLTQIQDGIIDKSTSINLIGKNTSGFGTAQNDNFLWLLENFSSNIEPQNIITGQIWYDSTAGIMRPLVNDGVNWRPLSVLLYSSTSTDTTAMAGSSASQPFAASQPGDFWYNSLNNQLYIQNNSGFQLIGPQLVPGFLDTQWRSTTIADSSGTNHAVMEMLVDGSTLAIVAKAKFDTTSSVAAIGFPTVYRGITFQNYSSTHRYITTGTDVALYGMNSFLDTTYPQTTQQETISSTWNFTSGITVGSNPSSINADGSGNLGLAASGGQVSLFVNNSTGVANFLQEGILPVTASQTIGNVNHIWNTVWTPNLNAGSAFSNASLTGSWQLTNNSTFSPFSDLGNNLGSSTLRFNSVYAGTLNPGNQTGTLAGDWKLASGTTFVPNADLGNDLGTTNQRFNNIYAQSLVAGLSTPLNITGEVNVTGDMLPVTSQQYNLGGPGLAWNTAYLTTVQANTVSTPNLSATFSQLTDSLGNQLLQFDTDGTLTADLDNRISTQHAVKTYVDNAVATLTAEIAALTTKLNNALLGVSQEINGVAASLPSVPVGTIFYHSGTSAPSGYLTCDGSNLPVSSYPDLFAVIGYTYGGNGGNSFALPDLRGEFVRGWDAGRGIDPGRNLGTAQADNLGSHTHNFQDVWMIVDDQSETVNTGNPGVTAGVNLDGTIGYPARDVNGNAVDWFEKSGGGYVYPYNDDYPDDGGANDSTIWTVANRTAPAGTAGEVRPKNVALLPIIKFRSGA